MQSEWKGQPLLGGPVWTPAEQQAIVEALERNGKVNNGKPAAADGYEALLKRLVVCGRCGYAVIPKQKTYRGQRRCWYVCSHRDRVTGKNLCECNSIKAEIRAVWEGWRNALTDNLNTLIARYRDEIAATVDAEEVKRLRANEERLVRNMREAIDRGLDADDPDEKKQYADRVADYKGQLALMRRRLASFTEEADMIEVDIPTIRRRVELGLRTQARGERRAILVDWIERIEWAGTDAVIILRVPLMVVNCKRGEPAAGARRRYRSASPGHYF